MDVAFDRFEKREFSSNKTFRKMIIIGSTVATIYSSTESVIKYNDEIDSFTLKEEYRGKDFFHNKQSFKRLHYTDHSKTTLIQTTKSYPVLLNIEKDLMKVNILSNIPENNIIINEQNSNKSVIIDNINDGTKEDSDMQQLLAHRDSVEKTGVILGVVLGFISLIPSLLSYISWGATMPAAMLFFSLSGFMLIRKKLRG